MKTVTVYTSVHHENTKKIQLREYITSDCEKLAELFYQTVHSVNSKDYTKEQLDVWATGTVDLKEWDKSFLKHYSKSVRFLTERNVELSMSIKTDHSIKIRPV